MVLFTVMVLATLGRPSASKEKSPTGNTDKVTPFGAVGVTSCPPVVGCDNGVAHPDAAAALIWVADTQTNTFARQAMAVFCAKRMTPIASSENPREANESVPTKRGIATAASMPTTIITLTSSTKLKPRPDPAPLLAKSSFPVFTRAGPNKKG